MRAWECLPLARARIGSGLCLEVPVRCDGSGSLVIGNGNCLGYRPAPRLGNGEILLQPRGDKAEIIIGDNNTFSNNVTVIATARITIGHGCQIGDQVAIYDSDFHAVDPAQRTQSRGTSEPVAIGNNVWLGSRALILKGVTIGDNSVVGAMSVVTKPVPANCVVAGIPAKVVRQF